MDVLPVGPVGDQHGNGVGPGPLWSVHIAPDEAIGGLELHGGVLLKYVWKRGLVHGVDVLDLVRHGGGGGGLNSRRLKDKGAGETVVVIV